MAVEVRIYLSESGTITAVQAPDSVEVTTEMADNREREWQFPSSHDVYVETLRVLRRDYFRECYDPNITERICPYGRVRVWRSKIARLIKQYIKTSLEHDYGFEDIRVRLNQGLRSCLDPSAGLIGSFCVHTAGWLNKMCVTARGRVRCVVSQTDPRFTTSAAERIAEFWRKFNADVFAPMRS